MAEQLRERVDTALREFLTPALSPLRDIGEELSTVADALAQFVLSGGKRLRPAFCYWAARAAGHEDSDALVRAAASLELLQGSALVHDDVIDHSDTRRGRPAVHRRFADLHRAAGWSGEAEDFGTAAAILIGDLLLSWSDAMLASSGIDDAALGRSRPISDLMRLELMAGQYLDIVEQASNGDTVDGALRVARFKAAKYTIERPMHLGAALSGSSPDVFTAFTGFGLPVGEAFQLRDDLLGVFGDPAVTGKPAGDDLRHGKRTVLVALALERADAADQQTLRRLVGRPDLSDDDVGRLRHIVVHSGVAAIVETMISDRVQAALSALEAVALDQAGRDALVELATAATQRSD